MTLDTYIQLNNAAFVVGIVAIGGVLAIAAWVIFERWVNPCRGWPQEGVGR